MQNPNSP
jgi:hypothetical protein